VALEPPLARRGPARAGPHPRLAPRGPCSRTAARVEGKTPRARAWASRAGRPSQWWPRRMGSDLCCSPSRA